MKNEPRTENKSLLGQMDWVTTLIPFVAILVLCFLIFNKTLSGRNYMNVKLN